jgi:hypothetical protein
MPSLKKMNAAWDVFWLQMSKYYNALTLKCIIMCRN